MAKSRSMPQPSALPQNAVPGPRPPLFRHPMWCARLTDRQRYVVMRLAVDCCVANGVRGGVTPWDLGYNRMTGRAVFGEEVDVRSMEFRRAIPNMYASANPEHTEAETAYGLGALLLTVVTCAYPWTHLLELSGYMPAQIEYQVSFQGRSLREAVPADAPQPEVAALIRACLNDDPAARPTLRGIQRALSRLTVLRAVGV